MLTADEAHGLKKRKSLAGWAAPLGAAGGVGWATLSPELAIMPADRLLNRGHAVADPAEILAMREMARLRHPPEMSYLQGRPGHEHDLDDFSSGFTQWNPKPRGGGIDYDKPSILLGRQARPWVAAHELGHAKFIEQHPGLGRMTMDYYNPNVPLLGGVLPSMLPTRKLGRTAALLGTLGSLPTVASEIGASHYGGKLLAQQSGNKLDYLKAYGGVPTYLAAAAAPLAAYGIASSLGRWDKDDEEKKRTQAPGLKKAAGDWCASLMAHWQ